MTFEAGKKPGRYSDEVLGKIYDVLVQHAGARKDSYDRKSFIHCALNWDYRFSFEYRFQGHLMFGGKIWLPLDREPYVSCYREDDSPERLKIIEQANKDLALLVKP